MTDGVPRRLPSAVLDAGREVDPSVRAAGVVPWRRRGGQLEVALIHRPKYDDWSWPKGKLEPGESWPAAAVRECAEETGLHVALGRPLPDATYPIGAPGGSRTKVVRYWAGRVLYDDGQLVNEVDALCWLPVEEAQTRLDYYRDRVQLAALVAADVLDALDTWPLALVRHATSLPRRKWKRDDVLRPLDDAGRQRAQDLVPLLSAYAFTRVVSSSSERCTATLEPYARATGSKLHTRRSLSEEGHADDPEGARSTLDKLLARAEPTAVCSHRPVLPALIGALADRALDVDVAEALRESAGPGLVKGEVLVAHLEDVGAAARVVAVERHDTR